MTNFAYFTIISHIISSLILIHSLIGIVALAMVVIHTINIKAWKSKEDKN